MIEIALRRSVRAGDRVHQAQMVLARATAERPLGLRQYIEPSEAGWRSHQQDASAVDAEVIDDLPEMNRRLRVAKRRHAEHQRHNAVEAAGTGNPHAEIGDHVPEMQADRSAPDPGVDAVDDLPWQRRLRGGKPRYLAFQLPRCEPRVNPEMRPERGQVSRLEIRPFHARRQGFAIDRSRDGAPTMPGQDLRSEARPIRPAAKEGALGIAQFLRRMDDDIPEQTQPVRDERSGCDPDDRAPRHANSGRGIEQHAPV